MTPNRRPAAGPPRYGIYTLRAAEAEVSLEAMIEEDAAERNGP
jgi:hypothetical protein